MQLCGKDARRRRTRRYGTQLNARFGQYLASYMDAGFRTKQLGNTYSTAANLLEQIMTLAIGRLTRAERQLAAAMASCCDLLCGAPEARAA